MAKSYHLLVVQYEKGDLWSIDFGDYDRETVVFEKECLSCYKSKIIKVLDNYDYIQVLKGLNNV